MIREFVTSLNPYPLIRNTILVLFPVFLIGGCGFFERATLIDCRTWTGTLDREVGTELIFAQKVVFADLSDMYLLEYEVAAKSASALQAKKYETKFLLTNAGEITYLRNLKKDVNLITFESATAKYELIRKEPGDRYAFKLIENKDGKVSEKAESCDRREGFKKYMEYKEKKVFGRNLSLARALEEKASDKQREHENQR